MVIETSIFQFLSHVMITSKIVCQTHQQRISNSNAKTISVLNIRSTYEIHCRYYFLSYIVFLETKFRNMLLNHLLNYRYLKYRK